MENKKKLIIILLIILLVLGVLGFGIYKFYNGIVEDKKNTEKQIKLILDNYDVFKKNINEVNNKRDIIYDEIFKDNYYNEMNGNQERWETLIKDYETLIEKLDKESKILKRDCKGNTFLNNDLSKSCESFSNNYELIINSFIQDIELYNTSVDSYNEWVEANEDKTLQKFSRFESKKYKKLIDYNKDGEFLGKE